MKPVWTKQKKAALWVLVFASQFLISTGLHSQVLMGDPEYNTLPQEYSILELDSNGNKGLRLPQLTGDQLTAMAPQLLASGAEAKGITVFDMDRACVMVWDGAQWMGLCGGLYAAAIAINVSPGDWKVRVGGTFSLSITVTGLPGQLAYQWYKDNVEIAGATASTYTKSNAALTDEGDYSCKVIGYTAVLTTTIRAGHFYVIN